MIPSIILNDPLVNVRDFMLGTMWIEIGSNGPTLVLLFSCRNIHRPAYFSHQMHYPHPLTHTYIRPCHIIVDIKEIRKVITVSHISSCIWAFGYVFVCVFLSHPLTEWKTMETWTLINTFPQSISLKIFLFLVLLRWPWYFWCVMFALEKLANFSHLH